MPDAAFAAILGILFILGSIALLIKESRRVAAARPKTFAELLNERW